jgi:hypothetical protein
MEGTVGKYIPYTILVKVMKVRGSDVHCRSSIQGLDVVVFFNMCGLIDGDFRFRPSTVKLLSLVLLFLILVIANKSYMNIYRQKRAEGRKI